MVTLGLYLSDTYQQSSHAAHEVDQLDFPFNLNCGNAEQILQAGREHSVIRGCVRVQIYANSLALIRCIFITFDIAVSRMSSLVCIQWRIIQSLCSQNAFKALPDRYYPVLYSSCPQPYRKWPHAADSSTVDSPAVSFICFPLPMRIVLMTCDVADTYRMSTKRPITPTLYRTHWQW